MCAAVVRYSLQQKSRTGVCTTYLQDRMNVNNRCPIFISKNPDFCLPMSGDVPIIMIGPGTGIAPFRAFIQERGIQNSALLSLQSMILIHFILVLNNAKGKNILYFGCRSKTKDFLYKDELRKLRVE